MAAAKWTAGSVCVLAVALDVLANVLVGTLTRDQLPIVINMFAVGVAAAAAVSVLVLHLWARLDAKLDLTIEVLVSRFDDVNERVGDRNSAFVEGFVLGREQESAPVFSLPARVGRRGNERR